MKCKPSPCKPIQHFVPLITNDEKTVSYECVFFPIQFSSLEISFEAKVYIFWTFPIVPHIVHVLSTSRRLSKHLLKWINENITFSEISYPLLQDLITTILQIRKLRLIKVIHKRGQVSTEVKIKGPQKRIQTESGTSWLTVPIFYWIAHWEHKLFLFWN